MNWTVILRPEAEADIQETAADLDQRSAGLGTKYVARLRHVLERLEKTPELYAPVWRNVRAVRLKKFPHIVYYVIDGNRVEVLTVLHAGRNPAEWQSRID